MQSHLSPLQRGVRDRSLGPRFAAPPMHHRTVPARQECTRQQRSLATHGNQPPAAAAQQPSSGASGLSSLSGLSVLQNTRPVDRLRFQAILVFKDFDQGSRGYLDMEQYEAFVKYSEERLGAAVHAKLQGVYDSARTAANARPVPGVDMESFIDIVREQVKECSATREFLTSAYGQAELGKMTWQTSLSSSELAAALCVFRLLDFNGDAYLKLEDLRKAQGIEREMVEDKLEDADTNEDGFLSFNDFLASYARERPVILNMLVLAAHTAAYWLILNLPVIDIPFKAILCMALVLKPQALTGPVIKLYTIVRAVFDRARAEVAMAQMRGKSA